jgi:uncharacterized MnhB-related membrane protein
MTFQIPSLLFVPVLLGAFVALIASDEGISLSAFAVFSLCLALVFLGLQAPGVAFAQLVLGAFFPGLLFFFFSRAARSGGGRKG